MPLSSRLTQRFCIRIRLLCALVFGWGAVLWAPLAAAAQQDVEVRLGASLKKKVYKRVTLGLQPELRSDGLNPDRYLLGVELSYKPIKYFSAELSWRSDLEEKKRGLGVGHRPAAALRGHLPLGDFDLSARFFYTYSFGYLRSESHRFRYKADLEYDVPRVPLDLGVFAEAFQELGGAGWFKMRYGGEVSFKFYNTKKLDQGLSAGYALDYYLNAPRNVHIVQLQYRLKF